MRRKDVTIIALVALISTFAAIIISGAFFAPPDKRSKVPTVDKINPSFPDINNDSAYKSILNKDALDLTQPIQIGNTQNSTPFNLSQ